MALSVIIPVRNDTGNLSECLAHLRRSTRVPDEIVVVDDASDEPVELTADDVRVMRLKEQSGPAAGRNRGAEAAQGDLLVFVDADVFVHPDTLERTERLFEKQDVGAAVGVFEDHRGYGSFFSDYKNLWMKFSYENCPRRAALFYTSYAAIRSEIFREAGGFDVRYRRPSTEDTAFGNTLWEMGVRPVIAPELQVFHNKEYSLRSLLRTDLMRASDLLRMKLRGGMGGLLESERTSVNTGSILSVGVTGLAVVVGAATGSVVAGLCLLVLALLLNRRFLGYLHARRGTAFLTKSVCLMLVDNFAAGLGLLHGIAAYLLGRKV